MEFLHAVLPKQNQYKDAFYTRVNGRFITCNLCGTGEMHKNSWKSHAEGWCHTMKYNDLKYGRELKARTKEITILRKCIGDLTCQKWQRHVKGALFSYVVENDLDSLHAAKSLLREYHYREINLFLDLALWKASICSNGVFSSMDEMREYVVLENDFDSKQFMAECRTSNGSSVIIPLVEEFLAIYSGTYEVTTKSNGIKSSFILPVGKKRKRLI